MKKFVIEEDTVEPINFSKHADTQPALSFPLTKSIGFNAIRDAFEKANYVEGSLPDTVMPVSTPIKVIVQPKKITNPELSTVPVAKVTVGKGQNDIEPYIQAGNARKAMVVDKATIANESSAPTNPHACIDCNQVFFMTDENEKWYTDKGWPIPKRCKACREKKAHNKAAYTKK